LKWAHTYKRNKFSTGRLQGADLEPRKYNSGMADIDSGQSCSKAEEMLDKTARCGTLAVHIEAGQGKAEKTGWEAVVEAFI
jgi:hypothetical protein